jgi:hypothetical protein
VSVGHSFLTFSIALRNRCCLVRSHRQSLVPGAPEAPLAPNGADDLVAKLDQHAAT